MLSVHETTYFNRLKMIFESGCSDINERTQEGTIKVNGTLDKYHMVDGIPLLQLRKINPDVPVREMKWFLRGETNIETLGAKIWDQWADENGDLGPIYGKQWRKTEWIELVPVDAELDETPMTGYRKEVVGHIDQPDKNIFTAVVRCEKDQIAEMLATLDKSPTDRCNITNAYNVADLDKMKLRPCHTLFAINTRKATGQEKQMFNCEEVVDLDLFQRSCDYPVGGYFNIYQYSVLLMAIAKHSGRFGPGTFNHHVVNNHIYAKQIPGVEMILREGIGKHQPLYMNIELEEGADISEFEYSIIGKYNPTLQKVPLPVIE